MPLSIPLTVTEPVGVARAGEGVRSGVPFAKGTLTSLNDLRLVDEAGKPVPAQFETLSKWDDGSQRWVLVNFKETLGAGAAKRYSLKTAEGRASGNGSANPQPAERVTITDKDDVFTVDTGRVRFDIPIYKHTVLSNIERKNATPGGGEWASVAAKGLEVVLWRPGVNPFKSHVESIAVESAGPVKGVIKIEGHHLLWDPDTDNFDPSEAATFAFILRVFVWAGSDEVRLQYTFINDNRDHKRRPSERYHVYAMEELADWKWINGRWVERAKGLKFRERELLDDDYGQINVRAIKLRLNLDGEYERYRFGVVGGKPIEGPIDGPLALEQIGPTATYESFYKEMPYPQVPFRAWVIHGKTQPRAEFEKAEGWVTMDGPAGSLAMGSKFFWQYHPKIYALQKNQLEFHLWNRLEDIPHPEIGFAKTHEVSLKFGEPAADLDVPAMMGGLDKPLRAVAEPKQYIGSGVFGSFAPADTKRWPGVEAHFLESTRNAEKHRAENNAYGVRDFGDTHGIRFLTPVWWNQEYDIMLGATVQFGRTAQRDYLDECDLLAWHFMDVDVLHASNSPLDEQGQHMHFTDHAKGETHAGHGTCEGLWHYHMLTGEPRAREVAEGIANFFAKIAAWKDFLDFRDDEERTLGWSLKALVSSYRATLNPRYRLAAQMVIEQALAGQDPDTGNWDHPLYPNEDKHRPVCIGGKPWMVGIILQGMKKYHEEFGDERVKTMITKAADWIIWSNYVYMTCSDHKPGSGYGQHLEGLSYSWELTGKRYYLDEVLAVFSRMAAGMTAESAGKWTHSGSNVEAMANMMRIVESLPARGDGVAGAWADGKAVADPQTQRDVDAMRADRRFVAKPQRRY